MNGEKDDRRSEKRREGVVSRLPFSPRKARLFLNQQTAKSSNRTTAKPQSNDIENFMCEHSLPVWEQ